MLNSNCSEVDEFVNELEKLKPNVSRDGVWTLSCCGLVVPWDKVDYHHRAICTRCVHNYTLVDVSGKTTHYMSTREDYVEEGYGFDAPKISKDRFQLIMDSTNTNGGTVKVGYKTSTAVWSLQDKWDTIHLIIESLAPWNNPVEEHFNHLTFGDSEVNFLKQCRMFERYKTVLVIAQNHFNAMTRIAMKEIVQRMSAAGQCLSIGF
jgi:hypothetical protein